MSDKLTGSVADTVKKNYNNIDLDKNGTLEQQEIMQYAGRSTGSAADMAAAKALMEMVYSKPPSGGMPRISHADIDGKPVENSRIENSKPTENFAKAEPRSNSNDTFNKVSRAGLEQIADKYLPKIDIDGDHNMSRKEIMQAEDKGVVPADLKDELAFVKNTFDAVAQLAGKDDDKHFDMGGISAADMRLLTKGIKPYKAPGKVVEYTAAIGGGCAVGGTIGGLVAGPGGAAAGCAVGGIGGGVGMYMHENSESSKKEEALNKFSYEQRKGLSDHLQKYIGE